jgi:hypothetical protein
MRYDKQKYKNGATELQTKTVDKAPSESFLQVQKHEVRAHPHACMNLPA